MKIRIKGNSIRLRLSKSEVTKLDSAGYLEEKTSFATNTFIYALKADANVTELSAAFDGSKMTVIIPLDMIKDWPANDTIGFKNTLQLTATDSLFILVEKDFICLDETSEDQSDNYENPNKTC